MPRPMYLESFSKKIFLEEGRGRTGGERARLARVGCWVLGAGCGAWGVGVECW